MQKHIKYIYIFCAAVCSAFYIYWMFDKDSFSVQGVFASLLSVSLFILCACKVISTWISEPVFDTDAIISVKQDFKKVHLYPWIKILSVLILSRILFLVISYLMYIYVFADHNSFSEAFRYMWLRTDSPSYLGIAENWYVTEGDPRFHIVFFPLYPIFIKLFWFITGNYFTAAMLVSNICALLSAVMMYELALLDMSSKDAVRTVKYLFLLPAAMFFSAPMTESLFLLLSVSAVYFIRKKKYLPACILGALASFTRSPGVLLLVVAFVEYLKDLRAEYRKNGRSSYFFKMLFSRGFCMALIPLGLLGYLLINYCVTGNPFQFAIYQKEHWFQRMGFFFNTASYQTENLFYAIRDGAFNKVFGLWIPNLIYSFVSLGIIAFTAKKMRASYSVYFLAYFVFTIGVTWLLSAPRYLTAAFPLAIGFACVTKNKISDYILTWLFSVLQIAYLIMYLFGGFHIY